MTADDDLYEYPADYVGRKTYSSVVGHSRGVPKYKTYLGTDSRRHLRPEYGGNWDALGQSSAYIVPDKAGYVSPMSGEFIEGRAAHRNHMKAHDVIEVGDAPLGYNSPADRAPMPPVVADYKRALQELNR